MSRTHIRSRSALIAVPLAALALAACGSDSATATTAAPATTAATPTSSVEVKLADSALGKILVDGAGNTLYLFTKDSASASACSGDCASNWPALEADGVPALGDGLDAEDFGTITGTDGNAQVTFYGHPLYYFAGDAQPGDTNGQNIGSVWFVIDGKGNAVTA